MSEFNAPPLRMQTAPPLLYRRLFGTPALKRRRPSRRSRIEKAPVVYLSDGDKVYAEVFDVLEAYPGHEHDALAAIHDVRRCARRLAA